LKDVSATTSAGKLTAWYAGTPEPDRFPRGAGNLPGHIIAVTLQRGSPPILQPVSTARLGWHEMEFHLTEDAAVTRLDKELGEKFAARTGQDFLRLTLHGSLGI